MAPEVISCGKKSGRGYGLAADWWSFGALAYDMMVGQPPFQVSPGRAISNGREPKSCLG